MRSSCNCSSRGRFGLGVDVRDGVARVGVEALIPKRAGRREARKVARRDWVLGNDGSGEGGGIAPDVDGCSEFEEEGELVRIALRSSSKSAALSTIFVNKITKAGVPAKASFCES